MRDRRILVLGLGNEIMGDDAVGILAARELNARLGSTVDVIEAPLAGFALLDILEGYDFALVIDSVMTGTGVPGTIREMSLGDFHRPSSLSPHVVGFHEVIEVARQLEIVFPDTIRILTCEVEDPYTVRIGLNDRVATRLPDLVRSAEEIIQSWLSANKEEPSTAEAGT